MQKKEKRAAVVEWVRLAEFNKRGCGIEPLLFRLHGSQSFMRQGESSFGEIDHTPSRKTLQQTGPGQRSTEIRSRIL